MDTNTWLVSLNEILPRLWVGNQAASQSKECFDQYKFTLIVNCTGHLDNKFSQSCKYYRIPVNDPGPGAGPDNINVRVMREHIPVALRLIAEELVRGGRVLVHCHAGMQRSAGLVCAFLMRSKYKNLPAKSAFAQSVDHMIKRRPSVFYGGGNVNFTHAILDLSDMPIGKPKETGRQTVAF